VTTLHGKPASRGMHQGTKFGRVGDVINKTRLALTGSQEFEQQLLDEGEVSLLPLAAFTIWFHD